MYGQSLALGVARFLHICENGAGAFVRNGRLRATRKWRVQPLRIAVAVLPILFCCGNVSWAIAAGPTSENSWTEEELFEARNWMPSASDADPRDQKMRPTSSQVIARYSSNRYRVRRRVHRVNLAEYKAQLAAKIGIRHLVKPGRPATSIAPMGLRHVGRHLGMGGGNLEGAGYSARSPHEALAACSFSQYGFPVLYQGVAKGRDGYFAYKIYRR